MTELRELLFLSGKKNEVIDENLPFEKALKRMETENIDDSNASLQKIHDAVLGMGRILEENKEGNYCLTTIDIRASAAILIARTNEGIVEIAAYAEEGIIRQHLARKAIEIFQKRWSLLRNGSTEKDKLE